MSAIPAFDLSPWPSLQKAIDTDTESHDGREAALLEHLKALPAWPSLANDPAALLAAIDDFSQHHEFLISVGPQKADVLSDIILKEKPRVVLELGGYLGYSAILFASVMRRVHGAAMHERPKIYSLESDAGFACIARKLVAHAGLSDCVEVIVGEASDSLRQLLESGTVKQGGVDLLFLDHAEELYVRDFKIAQNLGLFKKGSLVVADNVVRPGAPVYVEFMRSLAGWESEGVRGLIWPGNLEDEIEVSRLISSV